MQAITTKTDQVVKVCDDAPIDHLALFECTDDFRTNVRAATNSRGVSQHRRSLFDGSNDPLVSCHLVRRGLGSVAGQCTGADECSRPCAKVFSAKTPAHYFLDV